MSELKYSGKVKTFDSFKGFGFITRDKGKDVFSFMKRSLVRINSLI